MQLTFVIVILCGCSPIRFAITIANRQQTRQKHKPPRELHYFHHRMWNSRAFLWDPLFFVSGASDWRQKSNSEVWFLFFLSRNSVFYSETYYAVGTLTSYLDTISIIERDFIIGRRSDAPFFADPRLNPAEGRRAAARALKKNRRYFSAVAFWFSKLSAAILWHLFFASVLNFYSLLEAVILDPPRR